jgi:hypothetical protein
MDDFSTIGDLICRVLTFCLDDAHRPSLEKEAESRGCEFEQLVAASLARHIQQDFVVVPKELPGVAGGKDFAGILHPSRGRFTDTKPKIFISYRRDDSRAMTERLFDYLSVEFGNNLIFKDASSMPPGVSYKTEITEVIAAAAAVIVVIGDAWATMRKDDGSVRLFIPDDPVRSEIEAALTHKKPIFPVLVNGARIPKESELPDPIKGLRSFTALPLRFDPDFNTDVSAIIEHCREVCGTDYRACSLPIPILPLQAKLPVRVLAGCANLIREALVNELSGVPVAYLNEEETRQLKLAESVVTGWCYHFGLIEDI